MRVFRTIALLVSLSSGVASAAGLPSVDTWPDHSNRSPNDAAVVVGIDRYLLVPHVPYASRDAQAFWGFLVFDRGVPADRVTLLKDDAATKESIEAAVQSQAARVGPGGTLWFYFAGHGSPDPMGSNDAFLIGVDAQQTPESLATRSVPRSWLAATLGASGAGHVEMVLDSCFSGKTRTGGLLVAGLRPLIAASPVKLAKGTLLTAAGPDQLSGPLDAARHGLFTYFFLGALRGWGQPQPGGPVTVEGAYRYLRQSMAIALAGGDRQQTPEVAGPAKGRSTVLAQGLGEPGPELASLVGDATRRGAPMPEIQTTPEATPTPPPPVAISPSQYPSPNVPPSFAGTPVTFHVGSSSGDIESFHVAVAAGGSTFACRSALHQPCTLQLPQGRAHAHFDLVLDDGEPESMDEAFEVGTTAEIATPVYSNHHHRFVSSFVWYGIAALGVSLISVGSTASTSDPASGADLIAAGALTAIVAVSLGTLFLALGTHHEELKVNDGEDESIAPARSPAIALRGIGLAPLPGGGGTVGATFAF